MKYDQEYIYSLLLRKQLGELSEVENKLLQKVMETDEQVRNCYYEQEEAKRYTFNAFLEDLRGEHDWYKINAVLKPKPLYTRIFYFLKRYSTLAAILFTGMAIAVFHSRRNTRKVPATAVHLAQHKLRYHSFVKRVKNDTIYKHNSIKWNKLIIPPQADSLIEVSGGTKVHLNGSLTKDKPLIGFLNEVCKGLELEYKVYDETIHFPLRKP
ncbi:hypothetical protein SAMN05518672_105394 [Chitinophaga sp. CF118]|uniref:hypothetical protein n=1 Tax=Chitinophaga sp. CF118 TaxID=1884367 RepID=UPI0008EA5E06|nr:hypothetical protein [Chitinophaga sp. CF118]SFE35907.1 hypothetical protein SAMN05518672_105394 [Chitinophaga sp. CF118]